MAHITVQIQQSHSSSPQSHPKHGLVTGGFMMELMELLELEKVRLIGNKNEVTAMAI